MEFYRNQSQLASGLSDPRSIVDSPFGLIISTGNCIQHYIDNFYLFAGNKDSGYIDGHTTLARFNKPTGIAIFNRTIYVCDTLNHCIRTITNGIVKTLAGTGTEGMEDGPLLTAQFNNPTGICIAENIIYISESHRIRKIEDGIVTTIAGTGVAGFKDGPDAQFNTPQSLVWDDGFIYVADTNNHRIRKIKDGIVSTYAGSDPGYTNGPSSYATFVYPTGIACDMGNIYVSDSNCIRSIDVYEEVHWFSSIVATSLYINYDSLLALTKTTIENVDLLLVSSTYDWD